MKKSIFAFALFLLLSTTTAFAQQGFFGALGSGVAMNFWQLDKIDNAKDIHNYKESHINSIPISLEFGVMYFPYLGIGLLGSFHKLFLGSEFDLDTGNSNTDPIMDIHVMVEIVKGNLPINEYMSVGLDLGLAASYYSIGKETDKLLERRTKIVMV